MLRSHYYSKYKKLNNSTSHKKITWPNGSKNFWKKASIKSNRNKKKASWKSGIDNLIGSRNPIFPGDGGDLRGCEGCARYENVWRWGGRGLVEVQYVAAVEVGPLSGELDRRHVRQCVLRRTAVEDRHEAHRLDVLDRILGVNQNPNARG